MRSVKWRSPSNIALIKYWGKYPGQIPANPSISFTLSECNTVTAVELHTKKTDSAIEFEVYLDGENAPGFRPKIEQFLKIIAPESNLLKDYRLEIHTSNSFPHSSGIASSASGMSALALCLLDLQWSNEEKHEQDFFQKASEWARLGSGSAARSVYGPIALWGKYAGIPGSSDEYAIPFEEDIHSNFQNFCDYVLLVEIGSKSVSSTAGHSLMKGHPFAERRFLQGHSHIAELIKYMKEGDFHSFGELVESEALTLHAMMMSSRPYFMLMKPNTLRIIEHLWHFRKETQLPLYFTLDAGANVHLLFPQKIEQAVKEFVNSSLVGFLKNELYLCDRIGNGPEKIIE